LTAYATRADLYRFGLPRGLLANPARLCASALATTDRFELDGHGFETDDPVAFRVEEGGTLPAPLVAGTTYYAIRVNDSSFQVATAAAGSAINLTTNGTSVVVVGELPIDDVLESCSRWADDFLPGHLVPFSAPFPARLVDIVAELAAGRLLLIAHQSSKSVKEIALEAKAQLERWSKGTLLRDSTATASANLAVSIGGETSDPRGWGTGGTLL
jgi:hypothetical protein